MNGLKGKRALITGDAFSGTDGRFHVFFADVERVPFLRWLPRLLELPIALFIVALVVVAEAIGEATRAQPEE